MRDGDALLEIAQAAVADALRQGADRAEAYVVEGQSMSLTTRGRFSYPSEGRSLGVSVRVAAGRRLGHAGASGTHRLDATVRRALAAARSGAEVEHFRGFAPPRASPLSATPLSPKLTEADPARLESAADLVLRGVSRFPTTYSTCIVGSNLRRFAVASTEGIAAWDQTARESVALETRIGDVAIERTTFHSAEAPGPIDEALDLVAFGEEVAEGASRALNSTPLGSSVDRVILDPEPTAQVLSLFLRGLSGSLLANGQSPFADTATPAASEAVSVTDLPNGNGAIRQRMDHEGTPTGPLPLLTKGHVENFLFDALSASARGVESNGHGIRRAGWQGGVSPAVIHPSVAPGDLARKEIVETTERAILVTEPLVGFFTANGATGDFSAVVPFAFLVENGRITQALSHTTVGGNVHRIARSIDAVSRERHERRGGHWPTIRCGGVSCAS